MIGIVGFGGIGQSIASQISGFKPTKIIYTGHKEKQEGKKINAKFVSFDELLAESDYIFVACPLTPETKHMFNADAFEKMKSTSVFVNVARGGVVDQEALYDALISGKIFAAGLDVMTPEPLPSDHPLMSLPNCGTYAMVFSFLTFLNIVIFSSSYSTHGNMHSPSSQRNG